MKEGRGVNTDNPTLQSESKIFQFTIVPKPRFFVIGAVQIAQSLVSMAASTGYEVIVIDPRSQFATEQRFLGVEMYIAWPEEVLDEKKHLNMTVLLR